MNYTSFVLAYVYRYIMHRRWWYMAYVSGLLLGIIGGGIIMPLLLKSFVDSIASGGGVEVVAPQLFSLLWTIAFWVFASVFGLFVANFAITQVIPPGMAELETDLTEKVHHLSYGFFSGTHIGGLMNKVKRFVDAYNLIDFHMTRGLLRTTVQFTVAVVIISQFSWQITVLFLVWAAVFIATTYRMIGWKMKLDLAKERAGSKVSGIIADSFTNFLNIKIFSRLRSEIQTVRTAEEDRAHKMKWSWYGTTAIDGVQGVLIATAQVITLFILIRLWQQGNISIGTVVLIQTYLVIIGEQLLDVGVRLKELNRTIAGCIEMVDILRLIPEITDPDNPEQSRMKNGDIKFDDMSFSYRTDKNIFKDFSLHIPSGQKVGLVGYSGGGKSTITKLLLRFVDVDSGAITIDGQNIRNITQDNLRRSMSYVPQEPLLFHKTIAENIAYGRPEASRKEIVEAAKQAHAHEFIESLPDKYETMVGERGMKLSGGERQRIAIARVMLEQAPILVLDEATSSLDSVSEAYIQQAFEALMQGRTTIVIAHRLSTIRKMDRIVVVEHGTITEDGNHEELLRANGLYAKLHKQQQDGFLGG